MIFANEDGKYSALDKYQKLIVLGDKRNYLKNQHGYKDSYRMEIIVMQSKNVEEMSDFFIDEMIKTLKERVERFCIFNLNDDVNHRSFSVDFTAYNYFPIRLDYKLGRFGCSIVYGKKSIAIDSSQKWWDEADFDIFFKELQTELELRIPDKYLKENGWL